MRSDVIAWCKDLANSMISARNVTTQLSKDSKLCRNCDAIKYESDSR